MVDTAILWFRSFIAVVIMICDLFLFIKECPMDFSLTRKQDVFNWDAGFSFKACHVHNYQSGIRPQTRRRRSKEQKHLIQVNEEIVTGKSLHRNTVLG